ALGGAEGAPGSNPGASESGVLRRSVPPGVDCRAHQRRDHRTERAGLPAGQAGAAVTVASGGHAWPDYWPRDRDRRLGLAPELVNKAAGFDLVDERHIHELFWLGGFSLRDRVDGD